MLVARSPTIDGREMVILGITRLNLAKLLAKQPIRVSQETHGAGMPEDLVVIICYGDTEEGLAEELKAVGVLSDETRLQGPDPTKGQPS